MSRKTLLLLTLLLQGSLFSLKAQEAGEKNIEVQLPDPVMQGVEQEVKVSVPDAKERSDTLQLRIDGEERAIPLQDGKGKFTYDFEGSELVIEHGDERIERSYSAIPLWTSLLPPLIAIVLALIIREVLVSLFAGIFLGAAISGYYGMGWLGIPAALFTTIDRYILQALNDGGHLSVILFSMMIGGVVALISRNGGMQGVVDRIAKRAVTAKSGQMSTWALGVAIFFDDYANTLVVGNTMRPITDRLRVSREKLAYLVDSTAAPIAAVAFITTWIGAELGYIQDALGKIDAPIDESVYSIFINSLAYSFYPLFSLIFIPILILKGRDFGPMLKAERTARQDGSEREDQKEVEGDPSYRTASGLTPNIWQALIPIGTIVLGTFAGLIITGKNEVHSLLSDGGTELSNALVSVWGSMPELETSPQGFFVKLGTLIGHSDAYSALLWSSFAALVISVLMTVFSGRMRLDRSIEALLDGFKTMLGTILVLILAWSLAQITWDMHTADMLSSVMGEDVPSWAVPPITFVLAALVAFSTGSSWGTMAILYPLMLPLAWEIGANSGLDHAGTMAIFYNVTSCVLAGSVLGDHCSPISDTTILSSLSSSCDHIAHVRTQMPYALTVGTVSLLIGTLPSAFGIPFWICFPLGTLVLFLVVHFFGKRSDGAALFPDN